MMQDTVRTNLYRNAIEKNPSNFKNKVVMDVGCGSAILSMFAARAGAIKVYAVEASNMAESAKILIKANGFENIIEVIQARIEDITPEMIPGDHPIDVIISEPLGIYLLNERMLETYVIARDKFLKKGGRMFPTRADLCVIPFADQ
jgi:predicted RNA methylase